MVLIYTMEMHCICHLCKECFKTKNDRSDREHVCNPDDIETVKLIKSSTKPCPKCLQL